MSEEAFESINPANGEVFATTRVCADGAVEKALEQTARQSKLSGYGRELSHHGIREFVNVKTIWVQ